MLNLSEVFSGSPRSKRDLPRRPRPQTFSARMLDCFESGALQRSAAHAGQADGFGLARPSSPRGRTALHAWPSAGPNSIEPLRLTLLDGTKVCLREAEEDDDARGHLKVLGELNPTTDGIDHADYVARLHQRRIRGDVTLVALDEATGHVIGSASAELGLKFNHNCGSLRDIEDVVVSQPYRGRGVGRALIGRLAALAQQEGAYKAILYCLPENMGFYEKLGFEPNERQMHLRFDKGTPEPE